MQTIPSWGKEFVATPFYTFCYTKTLSEHHFFSDIIELHCNVSVLFKCRYSYAIVGINLTEMAYSLLRSGALKVHFYNTVAGKPEMHNFHQLYCE